MSLVTRLLVLAGVAVVAVPLVAAPVEVKLATLAPANTSWHKALLDMGARWDKETDHRVTLTVFAGGIQGDEATTLRKMRAGIDTLQAAFLTSGGLSELDDAFNVFGMPFFFQTDDEEVAVENKLTPIIEQKLQAKGFHLLGWGTGGWVQIFSKKPLKTLADLKGSKLYASRDDQKMLQWYVGNGFHPVGLGPAEIPTELKKSNGQIDTAPNPPYLALSLGIFRDANYMLDLHIAPLTGALIISNTAWNKISAEDRVKVSAAVADLEKRVRAEAPAQDATSVEAMKSHGLNVISLDAKTAGDFRAAATQLVSTMRGAMVPADVYDVAVQERDAVRKAKGGK